MKLTDLLLGTACPIILSLLPGIATAQDTAACIGKVPTLGVIAQGMPAVIARRWVFLRPILWPATSANGAATCRSLCCRCASYLRSPSRSRSS